MNWDLFVFIANILLTIGIIPQLFKNYRTKNVESHCIFWHISTMSGLSMLIIFYSTLILWISITALFCVISFRLILVYQIIKYNNAPTWKEYFT